jgi:CheY-like chemotaxis protein
MVAFEAAPADPAASAGRPVVLCVDDERPVLAALTRALRREPYELVTTEDPEEALERIRSGSVRLILADYRMRVMSGTSLLQMVKASSPSTIRIMLTGYPEDAWIRAAADNGLMRVCTKPWDDDELKRLIREQIRESGPSAALPGNE